MSENHGPEEINYGKKGGCVMWAAISFIVFMILLIWIYNRNGDGLPM